MTRCKKFVSILITLTILASCFVPFLSYAATENQIRNKIVSVASNEVGYKGTSTYSKYGEWYGYQGGWCTTFVFWCFNNAGAAYSVDLYGTITPSGGNCNSMISWYSSKGRYEKRTSGYKPKTGDLVFFDWSGNGSSQHVGIVTSVSGSTINTIEGNCSGYVKERSYTQDGSKPYNNISSILGYGALDFTQVSSNVSNGTQEEINETQSRTTTKKQTTTKSQTTTEKADANSGNDNKIDYEDNEESTNEEKIVTESTTESTTTSTENTTEKIAVEKLSINASTYDLQVGDTVKLNYSTEPENAPAVIGYFCDQEGIIEIDSGGDIRAIGEGTATVVVCANDELYSQCDFTVTEAVAAVSTTESRTRNVVGKVQETTTEKNIKNMLFEKGIDISMLTENKGVYVIPGTIICFALVIFIFVRVVKKVKKRHY